MSAGPPDSDELLDDATLARLRDEYASTGDLPELAALIRSFLLRGARELDALAGAAGQRDMAALSAGAHKLKGSSRSLGAMLVGAAAERLESAAHGGRRARRGRRARGASGGVLAHPGGARGYRRGPGSPRFVAISTHIARFAHRSVTALQNRHSAADPAATVRQSMDLSTALERHFGFTGFRPGQEDACRAALGGQDVLVVMPTGSGKSLCYQLPALLRDDLTIVVSPLVALMQDQVEALAARGLGDRVALVNAQQDGAANARALGAAARGQLKLLYIAPERFSSPGFAERMADVEIGLFVVDEAHCVSQWGHDFRPDYFRLADAARYLGARAIVASTATATPRVANDIVRRLGLRDPVRVATGFDRPNISFCALRPAPHEKHALLVGALKREDALPAIVYAGTRAGSDEKAAQLREELGVSVEAYHAGLDREQRAGVLRRFLAGEVQVVVATNAFGMGVDKADVRTVVHVSAPASLEAYYQEAGRAGRDGKPARALLLAENRDKALHVHFIKRDEIDEKQPERLAEQLFANAEDAGLPGPVVAPLRGRGRRGGPAARAGRRPDARAGRTPRPGGRDPAAAVLARPAGRAYRRTRSTGGPGRLCARR